jgi:hypothetical protein
MDGRSGEQPGATSESGPLCVKLSSFLVHTFCDCDFARNRGTLFCAPHSSPTAVVTHTICTQTWRRHILFKNDATRVDDVRAWRLGSDVRNLHRVATTHATAGHEEPPHWLNERPLRWAHNLHRGLIPDDTVLKVIPSFQMWLNSPPSTKTSNLLSMPLKLLASCF